MKFSVKTTPASVDKKPQINSEEMEALVLQMVALCIKGNPDFEQTLLDQITAAKNAA